MEELTTISQIGSRKSIAQLHIKKIINASRNNKNINHILYLVNPDNHDLGEYLNNIKSQYQNVFLYRKEDNNYTNFKKLEKIGWQYGGDSNYDFLIRTKEVKKWFLTLHDDSMIEDCDLLLRLKEEKGTNDFFGYCDTRKEISGYQKMYIDNIPLSQIRIGTWFFLGNKEIYLKNNYQVGCFKKRLSLYWYFKFKFNKRLRFSESLVWLNGGFPFNIQARLDNQKIKVLEGHRSKEDTNENPIAFHLTKITGFFTSRNLAQFIDKEEEITKWEDYFQVLNKNMNYKQIEFDKNFLLNIANILKRNEIEDQLINEKTINYLTKT